MAAPPCLAAAHGILLHGRHDGVALSRKQLLADVRVQASTFRSAGEQIGAVASARGLGFFDSREPGKIAFGSGAGLVVGLSMGAQSIRATIVDANGWHYYPHESEKLSGQLDAAPNVVLDRLHEAASTVIDRAFADGRLLIDGELPLLGWAVAWPTPIDRNFRSVGHALSHPLWRSGQPLNQRVRHRFGVPEAKSYALNDAHAAGLGVAHRLSHDRGHARWKHPRLAMVVRLAGGVSASTVVVEKPQESRSGGPTSGFAKSILIGGIDNHAGEIGHTPVHPAVVDRLNDVPLDGTGLPPLTPWKCSCSPADQDVPGHLEAYASTMALAARVGPGDSPETVIRHLLENPNEERATRALADVGALIGETLLAPTLMLNPATITLTGTLAVPAVEKSIRAKLGIEHRFGTVPEVQSLPGEVNELVRAKGAALSLIRDKVHRTLDDLLDSDKSEMRRRVADLTHRVASNPL